MFTVPTVFPSKTAKRPPDDFRVATMRSWVPSAEKDTYAPLVAEVRSVPDQAEDAAIDFQVPV
ncbi:hypothetical protein C3488_03720 [Streptomyces sp. Ru72]|nr:hypothetical protein C3488_03720 [Streptomyces sp. Ru72]